MAKWQIDQAHSTIGFEVKHMMVSKVKGQFTNYSADVEVDNLEDLTSAQIEITIDTTSINTNNEDRDNHLKSAEFFDIEQFPDIKFKSASITKDGDDYKVSGDLTIKDVTKPAVFDVEYGGKGTNPWGVEVYGFEAETKIDREEFGLTWNAALETGGVLVGKDIKIKVELELNPAQ
ncbi:YceI family protein [Solibacillus isronensis]|uniref:YceI family protein n=1 Tax=Solibacillus isronensis TaxID=412383 RepID=UPI00203E1F73|nr:YceI family protein [Solibacillus isronensis]MCM3721324.1 YceI family protein [Solibacillus isronensis]